MITIHVEETPTGNAKVDLTARHAATSAPVLRFYLECISAHTRTGDTAKLRYVYRFATAIAAINASTDPDLAVDPRTIAAKALEAIHYLESSKRANA